MPMRSGSATPVADHVLDAGLDVAYAVVAQRPVVQVDELLAEAGRAAHVGREDGDAVRQQRLVRGC